jgi:hypothetical protein
MRQEFKDRYGMGEERRGEFMKMLKGVSELELNVSLFP